MFVISYTPALASVAVITPVPLIPLPVPLPLKPTLNESAKAAGAVAKAAANIAIPSTFRFMLSRTFLFRSRQISGGDDSPADISLR
jgi:hypothetical protein